MKTIYNTYIEVTSQEQADRLKQMCIDNRLPIWEHEVAFIYIENDSFCCFNISKHFFLFNHKEYTDTQSNEKVTEEEFLKLLQDEIDTRNSKSE